MKRVNKLYEAIAIVVSSRHRLSLGLSALKFNKFDVKRLREKCQAVADALDALEAELETMLEAETGLTEQKKWENAAKNLGGGK